MPKHGVPKRAGKNHKRSLKNDSQKKMSKRQKKKIASKLRHDAHSIINSVSPTLSKLNCNNYFCCQFSQKKNSQKKLFKAKGRKGKRSFSKTKTKNP